MWVSCYKFYKQFNHSDLYMVTISCCCVLFSYSWWHCCRCGWFRCTSPLSFTGGVSCPHGACSQSSLAMSYSEPHASLSTAEHHGNVLPQACWKVRFQYIDNFFMHYHSKLIRRSFVWRIERHKFVLKMSFVFHNRMSHTVLEKTCSMTLMRSMSCFLQIVFPLYCYLE